MSTNLAELKAELEALESGATPLTQNEQRANEDRQIAASMGSAQRIEEASSVGLIAPHPHSAGAPPTTGTTAEEDEVAIAPTVIPAHLIDVIKAKQCVLFLGAGFSAPAGFPMWSKLLRFICDKALANNEVTKRTAQTVHKLTAAAAPSAHDLDQAAQLLEDNLHRAGTKTQERLVHYMRQALKPKVPFNEDMKTRLRFVRSLPWKAILTTNFNPLVEGVTPFDDHVHAAYYSVCRPQDPVDTSQFLGGRIATGEVEADGSLVYQNVTCPVIQIHGALRLPQSVVLTREGYRRLLYTQPEYSNFMRTVMSTSTICYVGFSFSDAYLNELRSEVCQMLGSAMKLHPVMPTGYAVINDQTEEQCDFFLAHEGVQFITWDTKKHGFGPCADILKDIQGRVA